MANVDAPFGFKPYHEQCGGALRFSSHNRILGTYATKIYGGDVVHLADTGYIELGAATETNLIGIFHGCQYVNTVGEVQFSPFWPAPGGVLANTEVIAELYEDPNMLYVCQTASGVAFARTHVGNNADMIATHAGVDAYGVSRQELSLAAPGAATAQFRIHGLANWMQNDYGEHAKVIVRINEHISLAAAGI